MSKTSKNVDTTPSSSKGGDDTVQLQSSNTKTPSVNPLTENSYAQAHIRSLFQHGTQLQTSDKLLLSSDLLMAVSQCASLFTVYLAGMAHHSMTAPAADGKKKKTRSLLSYEDIVEAVKDINIPEVQATVAAQAKIIDDKKQEQSLERKRAREEKKANATADGDKDDDNEDESSTDGTPITSKTESGTIKRQRTDKK